jgi:hypothetical protein
MEYIKDLKVRCGGTENYDYYGGCNFKRNKRDIETAFFKDNYTFTLLDAYGYNKALVYQDMNDATHRILVSYNTIVLEQKGNLVKINGWYSRTTSEHIKTYMNVYCRRTGFSKKDIENGLEIDLLK